MEIVGHFNTESAMAHLELSSYVREVLTSAYSQSHRFYHTLSHLDSMLRWVSPHPSKGVFLNVLLESILWHDIYYPASPSPPGLFEAISAAEYTVYSIFQGQGVPDINRRTSPYQNLAHETLVIEAINASSRHTEDQHSLSPTTKLFLDLDLQSFAQPWDEYARDGDAVADELVPVYGELIYWKGRPKFLEAMLKRDRIYYVAGDDWEEQARSNLQRSLEECRSR